MCACAILSSRRPVDSERVFVLRRRVWLHQKEMAASVLLTLQDHIDACRFHELLDGLLPPIEIKKLLEAYELTPADSLPEHVVSNCGLHAPLVGSALHPCLACGSQLLTLAHVLQICEGRRSWLAGA